MRAAPRATPIPLSTTIPSGWVPTTSTVSISTTP